MVTTVAMVTLVVYISVDFLVIKFTTATVNTLATMISYHGNQGYQYYLVAIIT